MAATEGTFFIKHNHAGHFSFLTLDVPGGSSADGVLIQQFVFHGGPNQRFQLARVGDGFFTITSVATGKALDVPGGSRSHNCQSNSSARTVGRTSSGDSSRRRLRRDRMSFAPSSTRSFPGRPAWRSTSRVGHSVPGW